MKYARVAGSGDVVLRDKREREASRLPCDPIPPDRVLSASIGGWSECTSGGSELDSCGSFEANSESKADDS